MTYKSDCEFDLGINKLFNEINSDNKDINMSNYNSNYNWVNYSVYSFENRSVR